VKSSTQRIRGGEIRRGKTGIDRYGHDGGRAPPPGAFSREKVGGGARERAQFSIDRIDAAANARPFSFRKPWVASSAEIARSDIRPPFGFCRRRRFARATSSGLRSAWLLRPSHLPASRRLRSRAPRPGAVVRSAHARVCLMHDVGELS
jgi:hypothetical protein